MVLPRPDGEATRLTYAEVDAFANMVANLLVSRGVQPGDKVALTCPNLPFFTVVYFGILKAGAAVVPLNVLLKARRVAYHLDDSDAKATSASRAPRAADGRGRPPGFSQVDGCEHFFVITADLAAPSPIEGSRPWRRRWAGSRRRSTPSPPTRTTPRSSSTPPAPPASPRAPSCATATCATTRSGEPLFGASTEQPDTYFCVLPLFHSLRPDRLQNSAFAYGGTVVMLPRFEAHTALRLMLSEGISLLRRRADHVLGPARRVADDPGLDVSTPPTSGWPWPAGPPSRSRCTRSSRRSSASPSSRATASRDLPVASFSKPRRAGAVGSIGTPIPGSR